MKRRLLGIALFILVVYVVTACGVLGGQPEPEISSPTPDTGIDQTMIAFAAQQTLEAIPTDTSAPQEEEVVPTDTQVPPSDTPLPPTETLAPTFTPTFTFTPSITPTATATVPSLTPDLTQTMEAQIASAKILVYEDIAGSGENLIARVDTAIKEMGYTSDNYVNVGSASGNFQAYLNSGVAWDLVILSLESRTISKHGLISDLIPHALNNGAIILEAWDLDTYAKGRALRMLDMCGVDVQKDWYRPNEYEPLDFFIHEFGTYSPVIRTPDVMTFPLRPNFLWMGDAGDLIKLAPGSNAQLIGGLYSDDPTLYGVMATCLDGRMVL